MNRAILVILGVMAALVVGVGVLVVVLVASGGDDDGTTQTQETPDDGDNGGSSGELRLIGPEPISLDPHVIQDAGSALYVVEIFGGIYGVKRLHPGKVMGVRERYVTHDCSTLGGNSGSAVVAFETGFVVGLHFGGNFRSRNFAVKASTLRERMEELHLFP